MRASWGVGFLLLATLVPGIPAQEAAAVALLEDGTADSQITVAETGAGTNGRWASLDLVALAAQETPEAFQLSLEVADLQASPELPFLESSLYRIRFSYGLEEYWVSVFRSVAPDGVSYFGYLSVYDAAAGDDATLGALAVEVDASAGLLKAVVPRDLILDENGAAPFPGTTLENFRVEALALSFGRGQVNLGPGGQQEIPRLLVSDRMPDAGNGTVPLEVRLGLAQSGHARLRSDVPVRASNGEATTFVFAVQAANVGDRDDRFTLSASGAPSTWQVSLPVTIVEIDAHHNVTLPVLVSTPFAHQHGTFQDFLVEMQSLSDPSSTGRVRLGIRYLAIPQPAGHHDTVFLHSRTAEEDPVTTAFATLFGFPLQEAYMNALEGDETDQDVAVPGELSDFSVQDQGPVVNYSWEIPLEPGLAMGLDFDLLRTGTLRIPLATVLPMTQAVLSGALYQEIVEGPQDNGFGQGADGRNVDRMLLARIEATAPADVAAQGEATFEAVVTPTPESDYVAFHPDAALLLEVEVGFVRVDPFFGPDDPPRLLPGGTLQLPLFEYRDAIDDVFGSVGAVMLEAQGPQEALVNPGETAVFRLRLMNHAEGEATFQLGLTGANAAWGRLLEADRVTLGPGESRDVAVAVAAPGEAADGEVADLILEAADTRAATLRTLARLVATVDTDADHPDQAGDAQALEGAGGGKESPGVPLGAAAALLALAALTRRR